MKFNLAWVALAAALVAQTASATSQHPSGEHHAGATFDFYGETLWDKTASSLTFSGDGGVSLTVKALVNGAQGLVDLGFEGLGVTSAGGHNPGAVSKGETLQLVFSQSVDLRGLILSDWHGALDHATLSWGDQSVSLGGGKGFLVKTFDLSNAVGTQFTLSGLGSLTGFRLAGLQLANPNCGAVPEPGTWALMGLGLVGIGGLRKLRQVHRRG